MRTHIELRKEAKGFLAEAKAIQSLSDDEDRDLTAEEQAQIEGLIERADATEASAVSREKLEKAEARLQELVADPVKREIPGKVPAEKVPAVAVDQDEIDRCGFADMGEFAVAVQKVSSPGFRDEDPRLERIKEMAAATGQSQANDAEGGILVPPVFSQKIWDRMEQDSDSLLKLCDVYPVDGESLHFIAEKGDSRANGYRRGGIRGYWLAEAAQMTASKKEWRGIRLEPETLGVLVYVTEKLLRNSPMALGRHLTEGAADEIAFLTGDAIVEGNGTGKPLGVLSSDSLITIAKETSQLAASLKRENLSKMWARMHPRCRKTAVWLLNVELGPTLDDMSKTVKNNAGTENVGGYADSAVYNATNNTIFGRPIIWCEYCSAAGTKGDIILSDFKAYLAGVRGGPRSAMSIHLRFDYAETAFRVLFDVGGQPWVNTPLTPFKGTATQSPFVTLAART